MAYTPIEPDTEEQILHEGQIWSNFAGELKVFFEGALKDIILWTSPEGVKLNLVVIGSNKLIPIKNPEGQDISVLKPEEIGTNLIELSLNNFAKTFVYYQGCFYLVEEESPNKPRRNRPQKIKYINVYGKKIPFTIYYNSIQFELFPVEN